MNRVRDSFLFCSAFYLIGCAAASAQTNVLFCAGTSIPPVVRSEGITERVGDIVLSCSGGKPGAVVTGNLSIFLNTNITNRISANNIVSGVILTVDTGAGPQPANVPGVFTNNNEIVYNGLSFTLSPTGTATVRIADLRANAAPTVNQQFPLIQTFLGFNSDGPISMPNTEFTVGTPLRSLYAGFSSKLVCSPQGSLLPDDTTSFAAFIASNAIFSTTRVTEGFADALGPRSAWANLNADTGERILVRYFGFPAGARLFVPDVVAGSDATQPTAGGDFGPPASGGKFTPSLTGSLLLARVPNADANGAGGAPVYTPGATGSGTVSFNGVSELSLVDGSAYVVYEVVDADPSVQESAQFPAFLGVPPFRGGNSIETSEEVFLAPVSTVTTASTSAPIPRFMRITPLPDCRLIGDCGAKYFPALFVQTTPLSFTAPAGSPFQVGYFQIRNSGGGVLRWNVTIRYQNGSGWLKATPDSGVNNGTVRLDVTPGTLAPGTYQATVTVDAGPLAGSQTVPVTLLVTPAATVQPPPPAITSVVSAASFSSVPVVPGSLTTVMGANFTGKTLLATFDGMPATILYKNGSQINLLVPAALTGRQSANLVVTVDGIPSAAQKVDLAAFSPAIFPGAVLNQDYGVNDANRPARAGSVIQIFATGLSGAGKITARIGDRNIDAPYYAGPAPGFDGVQQVDLVVPPDVPGATVDVLVCGSSGSNGPVCSPAAKVVIAAAENGG